MKLLLKKHLLLLQQVRLCQPNTLVPGGAILPVLFTIPPQTQQYEDFSYAAVCSDRSLWLCTGTVL
jgi:hypothetical protein